MSLILPVRAMMVITACALALVLAFAPAAGAHSAFLGAAPAAGQRVEASPGQLQLRFTERLNRKLTRIDLERAGGGERIPATLAFRGDAEVVLTPVRALTDGAYVVRWQAVSTEDGHPLEGRYSFGVRGPAVATSAGVESDPLRSGAWVRIPLRVVLYTSLLLLTAALLLRVLLPDRAGRPWFAPPELEHELAAGSGAGVAERVEAAVAGVGWLAVTSAVGVMLIDTLDAAGSISPQALRDYLLAGPAGTARIATAVLAAGAVWTAARRPRLGAVLAALAVGAVASSGHAGSAEQRLAAIVNDWAHLLGGAVWLGGIVLILYAWGPAARDPVARRGVARHVLSRFGRVAPGAFAVVVASGSVGAIVQLGELPALWHTAYGRLLAGKIVVVGAIAGLSYVHAIRLRPRLLAAAAPSARLERRHWRLIRAERPLALVVVALAGVLVAFPLPPRQLAATEPASASVACDPCPLRMPRDDELAIAAQAGRGVVAAWVSRGPQRLTGELRQFAPSGKPSTEPVRVVGDPAPTGCGTGCVRFNVRLAARLIVERRDRGAWHRAALPARWTPGGAARARRLLDAAQNAMRALSAVREDERVTSGPGTLAATSYVLRGPDRLRASTDLGVLRIDIGARRWVKVRGEPWQVSPPAIPFSVRTWFRWTPFAQAIQLLDERQERGRPVAEVAFFDPGTPGWQRLVIDLRTTRVLRGETLSRAHSITYRFSDFDKPARITAPRIVGRG